MLTGQNEPKQSQPPDAEQITNEIQVCLEIANEIRDKALVLNSSQVVAETTKEEEKPTVGFGNKILDELSILRVTLVDAKLALRAFI